MQGNLVGDIPNYLGKQGGTECSLQIKTHLKVLVIKIAAILPSLQILLEK